ncbi:MAG: hypothetical protein WCF85_18185 [Rhodospirillaceae bacterium]
MVRPSKTDRVLPGLDWVAVARVIKRGQLSGLRYGYGATEAAARQALASDIAARKETAVSPVEAAPDREDMG